MNSFTFNIILICTAFLAPALTQTPSTNALTNPDPTIQQYVYVKINTNNADTFFVILTESATYTKQTFFFTYSDHMAPPIYGIYRLNLFNSTHYYATIPPLTLNQNVSMSFQYFRSSGTFWNIIGITNSAFQEFPIGLSSSFSTQQTTGVRPLASLLSSSLKSYLSIISHVLITSQASDDASCYIAIEFTGVIRSIFFNSKLITFDSSVNLTNTTTIYSSQKILIKAGTPNLATFTGAYLNVARFAFEQCTRASSTVEFSLTPSYNALSSTPVTKNDVYYSFPQSYAIVCPDNCDYCNTEVNVTDTSVVCYRCLPNYYLYQGQCITICNDTAFLYPTNANGRQTCESTLRQGGFAITTGSSTTTSITFNVYLDTWYSTQTLAVFSSGQPVFGNHPAVHLTADFTLGESVFYTYSLSSRAISKTQTGFTFLLKSTSTPQYILFYEFNTSNIGSVAIIQYPAKPTTTSDRNLAEQVISGDITGQISLNNTKFYRLQSFMTCTSCQFSINADGNVTMTLNGRTVAFQNYFGNKNWTAVITRPFTGIIQLTFTIDSCSTFQLITTSGSYTPIALVNFIHYENITLPTGSSQCSITNCNNCVGTTCLSCTYGFFLNVAKTACVSTCPSGTYNYVAERKCVSTCPSSTILDTTSSQCVPRCAAGFYYSAVNGCNNYCNAKCLECYGPNANQCLTCESTRNLTGTSCLCPPGSSENATTLQCECPTGLTLTPPGCIVCASVCGTCNGPYETNCTSCNSPKHLESSSCKCPSAAYEDPTTRSCICPSGQFPDTYGCFNCFGTCKECSGANINMCTSCNSPRTLNGNTCQCPGTSFDNLTTYACQCPDGQYLSGSTCINCDSSCSTCTNTLTTGCLTCKYPRSFSSGLCVCPPGSTLNTATQTCDCPSGYFVNQTGCSKCHATCGECTGPTNTQCTSCSFPRTLSGTKCLCPSITTDDQTTGECSCGTSKFYYNGACQSCNSLCLKCFGPNNNQCSDCPTPKNLQSDNTCGCPTGSIESSTTHACSCPSPYMFINNTGCFDCNPRCLTCSGGGSTQCSGCSNALLLVNTECFCRAGLFDFSTKTCGCASGQYPGFESCYACDKSCAECTGPTAKNCTSCQWPLSLKSHTCRCPANSVLTSTRGCQCPVGYYMNSSAQCDKCHPSCKYCTGPNANQCTDCLDFRYLNSSNFCPCYSGFTDDMATGTCSCPSTYYQYTDGCQECPRPKLKIDDKCLCPNGTYPSTSTSVCSSCHEDCKTCSGGAQNDCLSCYAGYTFVESQSRCLEEDHAWKFNMIYAGISAGTMIPAFLLYVIALIRDSPFTRKRSRVGVTDSTILRSPETEHSPINSPVNSAQPLTKSNKISPEIIAHKPLKLKPGHNRRVSYEVNEAFRIQLELQSHTFKNQLKRYNPFFSVLYVPHRFFSRQLRLVILVVFLNCLLYSAIGLYTVLDILLLRGDIGTPRSYITVIGGSIVVLEIVSTIMGLVIKSFVSISFKTWPPKLWHLALANILTLLFLIIMAMVALIIDYIMLNGYFIRSKNYQVIYIFAGAVVLRYFILEFLLCWIMSLAGENFLVVMKKIRFSNLFHVLIIAKESLADSPDRTLKKIHNKMFKDEVEKRRRNFTKSLGFQENLNLRRANNPETDPNGPHIDLFATVTRPSKRQQPLETPMSNPSVISHTNIDEEKSLRFPTVSGKAGSIGTIADDYFGGTPMNNNKPSRETKKSKQGYGQIGSIGTITDDEFKRTEKEERSIRLPRGYTKIASIGTITDENFKGTGTGTTPAARKVTIIDSFNDLEDTELGKESMLYPSQTTNKTTDLIRQRSLKGRNVTMDSKLSSNQSKIHHHGQISVGNMSQVNQIQDTGASELKIEGFEEARRQHNTIIFAASNKDLKLKKKRTIERNQNKIPSSRNDIEDSNVFG